MCRIVPVTAEIYRTIKELKKGDKVDVLLHQNPAGNGTAEITYRGAKPIAVKMHNHDKQGTVNRGDVLVTIRRK